MLCIRYLKKYKAELLLSRKADLYETTEAIRYYKILGKNSKAGKQNYSSEGYCGI
jgi:hypothetical protein